MEPLWIRLQIQSGLDVRLHDKWTFLYMDGILGNRIVNTMQSLISVYYDKWVAFRAKDHILISRVDCRLSIWLLLLVQRREPKGRQQHKS